MKMPALCMKCGFEGYPSGGRPPPFWEGEVLDDCSIVGTCPRGHHNVIGLQMPKFDFLFQCAGRAFLDSYYRECVLGVATSIERFFEFYVRFVCRCRKVDPDEFQKAWKPLNSLSERQRGAFGLAYLLHMGKAPELGEYDDGKWKKLRNRATHQGYLPTREEALAYGEWALATLHAWMIEMCQATPGAVVEFHHEASRGLFAIATKHAGSGTSMTTFGYRTILRTNGATMEWGTTSFEKCLKEMTEDLAELRKRGYEQTAPDSGMQGGETP
jgi:hypothetical protein